MAEANDPVGSGAVPPRKPRNADVRGREYLTAEEVERLRRSAAALGRYGERDAAICHEMTKMHEEVHRATLAELAHSATTLETRGEFVLVVGPPSARAQTMTGDALDELLRSRLERDSVKDAVAHAVEMSGRPRREIYARALELAKQAGDKQAAKGAHDQV